MKANLTSISKRAQGFLGTPEFFKGSLTHKFEVIFNTNDKILTVFHRENPADLEFIFAETLARFSKNKNIPELWKINFREVDSFLRDENHLPAFQEDGVLLEKILLKTKISLIASAVKAQLKSDFLLSKETNLAAKNLWAQKLITPLGWELVLYEHDVLTVTGLPEGVPTEALEELLKDILEGGEKVLPMKVVAV